MKLEWWNGFSWIEAIRTVEINQVIYVEDGLAAELVEGTEANVCDKSWQALEDIEIDWR